MWLRLEKKFRDEFKFDSVFRFIFHATSELVSSLATSITSQFYCLFEGRKTSQLKQGKVLCVFLCFCPSLDSNSQQLNYRIYYCDFIVA